MSNNAVSAIRKAIQDRSSSSGVVTAINRATGEATISTAAGSIKASAASTQTAIGTRVSVMNGRALSIQPPTIIRAR